MSPNLLNIVRKNSSFGSRREGSDPFSIQEGRFSFGGLKDSSYYSDWTEESFLVDTGRKEMVTSSFNFGQLRYFLVLAFLCLSILIGRTFWLQISKNEHYALLAEGNRLRSEIIEPKRGIIYSRDLQPLVRNKANFVLYFKPIELPRDELARDTLLREISAIIGGTAAPAAPAGAEISITADNDVFYQMKEAISKVRIGSLESYQSLFVADNIEYDRAMLLSLRLAEWPGVFLSSKIRREYLAGTASTSPEILGASSLSHLLGYTGKISEKELASFGKDYSLIDYVGKMGIEYSWEKDLKGRPGSKNIEVDALGRHKKIVSETPPEDGFNLRLSLDAGLQQKVEETVKEYLEPKGLKRAAVVIIDPRNGEILSLVSLPAYDNNQFARGILREEYAAFLDDENRPLFNRAVSGEFPSGSTIKPIFSAGALQEGIISEHTTINSAGGVRIGEWFFPDWQAGGHGQTDVRRAIAWSVNTFYYYVGGGYGDFKGLGLDGLVKYAKLFGLGQITGLDLPGERAGFVPTAEWKRETKGEPWYIGDTYHFSIGQGDVLVTPLQVANYTAAIANGGTLYRPHLVSQILDAENRLVRQIEPEIIRQDFIDPEHMRVVREGMRETVVRGSARSLGTLPISSAGKTGTAQWSSKKDPHGWYVGFAPYEDPEIAFAVLVEEGVGGNTYAVPIAREILAWYFANRD